MFDGRKTSPTVATRAAIAQLGEHQAEVLKVPGSRHLLQAEKVAIPESYLVLGPGEEIRKEVFRMASGSSLCRSWKAKKSCTVVFSAFSIVRSISGLVVEYIVAIDVTGFVSRLMHLA